MSDTRIDLSDFGVTSDSKGTGGGRNAGAPARRSRWWRRVRLALLLTPFLAVVPFALLLRGGVHAHQAWGWSTWPSIGAGILFASLSLGAITWSILTLFRFRGGVRRILSRGALLLGIAYAGYGLVYIATRNAKGEEVRSEYRALHPLLRLASTTLVLLDGDAVVTDASRSPEEYSSMGLPPAEASLHYRQADGYVHALDLRTRGRAEWRNALVRSGFGAMGFRTLRHVGTADHLHVSLPVID